jgi:Flp pilus assembly pilin Flp
MIRFGRRLRQEDGQDAVEYVLLALLVSLAITAGMSLLAGSIDRSYNDVAACLSSPTLGNGSQGQGGGTGQPGGGSGQGGSSGQNVCP